MSRRYPAIPTPVPGQIDSMVVTIAAMKRAVEMLEQDLVTLQATVAEVNIASVHRDTTITTSVTITGGGSGETGGAPFPLPGRDGDDGLWGPPGLKGDSGSQGDRGAPGRDGDDALAWGQPVAIGGIGGSVLFNNGGITGDSNWTYDPVTFRTIISGTITRTVAQQGTFHCSQTVTNNVGTASCFSTRGATFNGTGTNCAGVDATLTFAPSASITSASGFNGIAIGGPPVGVTIDDLVGARGRIGLNTAAGAITRTHALYAQEIFQPGTMLPTEANAGLTVQNQGFTGCPASYGVRIRAQSGSTLNLGFTCMSDRNGFGTETPDASALLDMVSTTQGFGPPAMTTAQRDAISAPRAGLMIYNTSTSVFNFYNGAVWGAV